MSQRRFRTARISGAIAGMSIRAAPAAARWIAAVCRVAWIAGATLAGALGWRPGAVSAAQVCPVDVGSQVFAADGAIGGALDGWASLGRDAARLPIGDRLRAYRQDFSQYAGTTDIRNCTFDCSHAPILHVTFRYCKRCVYQQSV